MQKDSKNEKMTLKDYERKLVIERGGKISDNDENSDNDEDFVEDLTHIQKETKLKESMRKAFSVGDDSNDENDDIGGLLKKREKSQAEKDKEENDFLNWLKNKEKVDDSEHKFQDIEKLKDYWHDPKLDEGERFLRDYILQQKYKENDEDSMIPTYDEIVENEDIEDDKQDEFERKYNFRFEEPDDEFIKHYPRTVGGSVRRIDDKRKLRRQNYAERKAKEKERVKTEIAELKKLKKMAIEDKLKAIRKITGDESLPINPEDLTGDFDPNEHDRRMQAIFNENYYQHADEDDKPMLPDDINFEKSFDLSDGDEPDQWDNLDVIACKNKSASNIKNKLKQVVEMKKPTVTADKPLAEYIKEYYDLEYEDVIAGGDVKCKFKYRSVPSNDFGLSIKEILKADDKELNAWASLKKTSQYRSVNDECHDQLAYKRKAENIDKKKRILGSVYSQKSSTDVNVTEQTKAQCAEPKKKRRKRNKSKKNETKIEDTIKEEKKVQLTSHENEGKLEIKIKNKQNRKMSETKKTKDVNTAITDDRLAAFGINPKKYRNSLKYKPK